MNELSNSVTSVGNYNNIPTSLTSNTLVVKIIDGLTLTKEADKKNWKDGLLTYTITLNNGTDIIYKNSVITDIIDTNLVEFVPGSVVINDVPAVDGEYSYNNSNHTLMINLDEIGVSSNIITFKVKKRYNSAFILKSCCKLYYDDGETLRSNFVSVLSLVTGSNDNFDCSVPYWRI